MTTLRKTNIKPRMETVSSDIHTSIHPYDSKHYVTQSYARASERRVPQPPTFQLGLQNLGSASFQSQSEAAKAARVAKQKQTAGYNLITPPSSSDDDDEKDAALCVPGPEAPCTQRACRESSTRKLYMRRTQNLIMPPCHLLREEDSKTLFVDSLVDAAAIIVNSIWPNTQNCRNQISMKIFIQETLRRSRTSFSTMQLSLFYCVRLQHKQLALRNRGEQVSLQLTCGRRVFLASLILGSKYLQDRNYSNRAWSKISGLSTSEINLNEKGFLNHMNWEMFVSQETFEKWSNLLQTLIADIRNAAFLGESIVCEQRLSQMIQKLDLSLLTGRPEGPSFSAASQLLTPATTPTTEQYESSWPVSTVCPRQIALESVCVTPDSDLSTLKRTVPQTPVQAGYGESFSQDSSEVDLDEANAFNQYLNLSPATPQLVLNTGLLSPEFLQNVHLDVKDYSPSAQSDQSEVDHLVGSLPWFAARSQCFPPPQEFTKHWRVPGNKRLLQHMLFTCELSNSPMNLVNHEDNRQERLYKRIRSR